MSEATMNVLPVMRASRAWRRTAGALALGLLVPTAAACGIDSKNATIDVKGCHRVYVAQLDDTIWHIAGLAEPGNAYNNGQVVTAIEEARAIQLNHFDKNGKPDTTGMDAVQWGQLIPLPREGSLGELTPNC